MKNKIIYIFLIIFLFVLIVFYNIYSLYVLNYYSSEHFSLDYNKNWYIKENGKNSLVLNDSSGSSVGIVCKKILSDEKKKKIEDIYFDYEEDFRVSNKFNLVNYGDTKVGKDYVLGKEYLYEYKNYQIMLLIVVKNNYVYEINYSSLNQNFDLNIEEFYDIINGVSFY